MSHADRTYSRSVLLMLISSASTGPSLLHPLEFAALLAAARTSGPNDHALVCLLGMLGLRVSEGRGYRTGDPHYRLLDRAINAAHPGELASKPRTVSRTLGRSSAAASSHGATAKPQTQYKNRRSSTIRSPA
jgi:hypothetical protein